MQFRRQWIDPVLSASFMKKTECAESGPMARDGAAPQRFDLGDREAMRWRARTDGALHVVQGRLWITFDWPARGLPHRSGDHFVAAGGSIMLRAGEAVALEPFAPGARGQSAAQFEWRPVATCAPRGVAATGPRAPSMA